MGIPRGTKPKPAKLRLLQGNPRQKPIPIPPQPAIPNGLLAPPDILDEEARAEWARVVPELQMLGLLTHLDVMPLAAYCAAYSNWVEAQAILRSGDVDPAQRWRWHLAVREAAAAMVRYAGEFGLAPVARQRLAVNPHERPRSKFDGLIGR